jgi:TPR repeat protein
MFYLGRALTILEQHDEAIDWYRKAASQRYPPAVFRVGVSHLLGQGTLCDTSKAKDCFRQAAKAGHILAKGQLARLYLTGKSGLLMIPVGAFLMLRLIFETWKVAATDKEFIEELVG